MPDVKQCCGISTDVFIESGKVLQCVTLLKAVQQ